MNSKFIIFLIICFFCYIIRAIYEVLNYKNTKIAKNKFIFFIVANAMAGMWISWFNLSPNDPLRIESPVILKWIGFSLFLFGVLVFVIGIIQIIISSILSKWKKEDKLITYGIFYFFRHPMYLGFILWLIGYPIYMGSVFTLITGIFWISNVVMWKILEEKELIEKFPEYIDYKNRTLF